MTNDDENGKKKNAYRCVCDKKNVSLSSDYKLQKKNQP